jgi:branched-subunit amino acid ABC-type transport system permease component
MAWLVFWLPPTIVPSRVAVSTASIFSLIALGFSIRLGLPQVGYMTRADIFVLGATLLVFLGLGIVIAGSRMALKEHEAAAENLNAVMRWLYPVLYCLIVVVAGFS